MPVKDIRDFIFSKLFFPKVAVIDRPGIIISKTSSRYGGRESKRRNIWIFEDILVDLQLEAIKELDKKKTEDLWYKIGKDITTRYLLLSGVKEIPKFLLKFIIEYIFTMFRSTGQSFAEKVTFNPRRNNIILEGENNVVCRKTTIGSFNAGVVSGIISFLVGQNIEARAYCDCPRHCKIIADPTYEKRYIPDHKKLVPDPLYSKLNFPQKYNSFEKMNSFSDMMRFKKIEVNEEQKFIFKDKVLIVGEIGMMGIISDYFINNNLKEWFNKTIIKSTERLAFDILPQKERPQEKLKTLLNILCAFGNGIPQSNLTQSHLDVSFLYAPYTKYGFYSQALVLNGFVNIALGKKFKLKDIKFNKLNSLTTFVYT